MKIPMMCTTCFQNGQDGVKSVESIDLNDTGRFKLICKNGHTTIVFLNHQKFQILFEIGINAIIDGYYREAVSSFTSSLERFYEFFSKVICITRGIEWTAIEDTWNSVSKQSERQIGAFIFLYLLEFRNKPSLLPNNKIEFRNNVIHKGEIPCREKAIAYGQAVLDVIRPLLISLRTTYEYGTDQLTSINLRKNIGDEDKDVKKTSLTQGLVLSLSVEDPTYYEEPLNDIVERIKSYRPKS
ncbi:hypothetical protein ABUS21_12135 [Acinetobacter baumannii]|uniref:hypothetical protein n=1 Tax=Acinetobacter baumannii TaxID=470 RepID=UPI003D025ADE